MPFYRYGRWDGTQEVPDLSAEELVDRVADEMLETGDLRRVLRRMMQFGTDFPGGQRMQGLRDLLERLQQRRDQNLEQYNLDSMMDDIQEKLDQIIERERQTVEDALKDAPQGKDDAPRSEGPDRGPEGKKTRPRKAGRAGTQTGPEKWTQSSSSSGNGWPSSTWSSWTSCLPAPADASRGSSSTTSWTPRPARSSKSCSRCCNSR